MERSLEKTSRVIHEKKTNMAFKKNSCRYLKSHIRFFYVLLTPVLWSLSQVKKTCYLRIYFLPLMM